MKKIINGRPAPANGLLQHLPDRLMEADKAPARDLVGTLPGMDPGPVKRFIRINIPETRNKMLV